MKRLFSVVFLCMLMTPQAKADTIKWVDFQVPYESLKYAMERDIVRLADFLGHSNINTTRIYTMESGAVHRKQIEKLELLCRIT